MSYVKVRLDDPNSTTYVQFKEDIYFLDLFSIVTTYLVHPWQLITDKLTPPPPPQKKQKNKNREYKLVMFSFLTTYPENCIWIKI